MLSESVAIILYFFIEEEINVQDVNVDVIVAGNIKSDAKHKSFLK